MNLRNENVERVLEAGTVLPYVLSCNCCGRSHAVSTYAVICKSGDFWMDCDCGNTVYVPKRKHQL